MKTQLRKIGILSLSLFVVSFAAQAAPRPDPARATASAVKDFGFELLQSLHGKKKSDPVAISPMSIAEAVTLSTHGAEKETLTALEDLFLSESLRENGANLEMLTVGVERIRKQLKDFAEKSKGTFEYSSANALWGNNNPGVQFKFEDDFLEVAEKSYGAKLTEQDFAKTEEVDGKKVQVAVRDINKWVAKETKDRITDLISELGPDDIAVVLNAIYAKGKFKEHFPTITEGTYQGLKEKVSYLTKQEQMGFYEDDTLKAFSFKVEENNERPETLTDQIALDILVPKGGDLAALVKSLDGEYYDEVVSKLEERLVELTIPAGTVKQSEAAKLKDVLKADPFRLVRPFSDRDAQFARLGSVVDERNIYINDILTKTFYELTPFGFEAAAATAVVFARESAVIRPPQAEKHKVTSGALHIVRHIPTGLPLFIVEYDSPKRYTQDEIVKLVEEGFQAHRQLSAKLEGGTIRVGYDEKEFKPFIGRFQEKEGEESKVLEVLKKLEDKN